MYLAVARPITLPVRSNTGPPELPGLIAAFVVPLKEFVFTLETMPVVRTPGNPSGLPSTPTHQPCRGAAPSHCNLGSSVVVTIPAKSLLSSQEKTVAETRT